MCKFNALDGPVSIFGVYSLILQAPVAPGRRARWRRVEEWRARMEAWRVGVEEWRVGTEQRVWWRSGWGVWGGLGGDCGQDE